MNRIILNIISSINNSNTLGIHLHNLKMKFSDIIHLSKVSLKNVNLTKVRLNLLNNKLGAIQLDILKDINLKPFKVIFSFIFIITFITILNSCSTTEKIEIDYFDGNKFINAGDSTHIVWKFKNAEAVEVENSFELYNSIDSILVSPPINKTYRIKAYNTIDTINLISRIMVNATNQAVTGNEISQSENLISTKVSNYWNGIKQYNDNLDEISRLKIVKSQKSKYINKHNVDFLLFDNYGNFINNINIEKLQNIININLLCENGIQEIKINDLEINNLYNYEEIGEKKINIHIIIENSMANIFKENILSELKKFVKNTNQSIFKNAKFNLYFGNHTLDKKFKNISLEKVISELNYLENTTPEGTNAQYYNLFELTKEIAKNEELTKEVNLIYNISYTNDNSSFMHTINDIQNNINKSNINLFNIHISNLSEIYNTKLISKELGTTYYFINEEEFENMSGVMTEILMSQFFSYQLSFTPTEIAKDCNFSKIEMSIKNSNFKNDSYLTDIIDTDIKSSASLNRYKTLALFDYKNGNTLKNEYKNLLDLLAITLLQNQNNTIELVGHSGIEGNEDICFELGNMRVNLVKNYLIAKGVNSNQLKIKTEGSNKPIYYISKYKWQEAFNRRVEMRWLDEDSMPYEILTEICNSETEATERVEQWQKAGYLSYFERYLVNNSPTYKVKLWGFRTIKDAEATIQKLEKTGVQTFTIE